MSAGRLFLENEEVLDFAFKNESYLGKRQSRGVYFSALYVADLVITNARFYGQLILGYAIVHPQLPQTFAQPPPEFVLLFRGHRSKVPLTATLNSPIYRAINFVYLLLTAKKHINLISKQTDHEEAIDFNLDFRVANNLCPEFTNCKNLL